MKSEFLYAAFWEQSAVFGFRFSACILKFIITRPLKICKVQSSILEQVVIEIDAEDFSVATGEQNIACRLYVPSNGKIFALGSYVLQCRIESN